MVQRLTTVKTLLKSANADTSIPPPADSPSLLSCSAHGPDNALKNI